MTWEPVDSIGAHEIRESELQIGGAINISEILSVNNSLETVESCAK